MSIKSIKLLFVLFALALVTTSVSMADSADSSSNYPIISEVQLPPPPSYQNEFLIQPTGFGFLIRIDVEEQGKLYRELHFISSRQLRDSDREAYWTLTKIENMDNPSLFWIRNAKTQEFLTVLNDDQGDYLHYDTDHGSTGAEFWRIPQTMWEIKKIDYGNQKHHLFTIKNHGTGHYLGFGGAFDNLNRPVFDLSANPSNQAANWRFATRAKHTHNNGITPDILKPIPEPVIVTSNPTPRPVNTPKPIHPPVSDTRPDVRIPRPRKSYDISLIVNCDSRNIDSEATKNNISVRFYNGERVLGKYNLKMLDNKNACNTSPIRFRSFKRVTKVKLSTNGKDKFFIDSIRLMENNKPIKPWGKTGDERGWCLSKDPGDAKGRWSALVNSCDSEIHFPLSGKITAQ